MDAGILALFIPILALTIPIVALWTNYRSKIVKLQINATAEMSAEKAAQYASHTSELEARVRVLERIVTDKGYDVASQIEALRDARQVEALLDKRETEIG
jgi:hypothetical protein